jgi:hypothetical protein
LSFDYTSGCWRNTHRFTFAVNFSTSAPGVLTEHDTYKWPPAGDPPVTEAVKDVRAAYQEWSRV